MNDLLIPLFLLTGMGLIILLVNTLRQVDHVNKIIETNKIDFTHNTKATAYLRAAKYFIYLPALLILGGLIFYAQSKRNEKQAFKRQAQIKTWTQFDSTKVFESPDPHNIKQEDEAELIQYGRDLVAHTADYLGPKGFVKPISNGMNCQNCHLDAGSKPFGNNYFAVAATYPKFRARSGTAETIYKRVNDCFQRSLNGQALDSSSHEMKAIETYIKWLGQAVPKGKSPKGVGLVKLPFLNRAANPDSGRIVLNKKCQSCHGADGQGLPMPEGNGRVYPPLWGEKSYNEAAGLYRVSNFAGYIKANMPFGATYQNPQLSDAEAWDLAAFVNAQPRPKHPFLKTDWPKISGKPFDHPFGPYSDSFPETQHKFGPYQPIVDFQKKKQAEKK